MPETNDPAIADHVAAEGALGQQAKAGQHDAQVHTDRLGAQVEDRSDALGAQVEANRLATSDGQRVLADAVEGLAAEARRVAGAVAETDRKGARSRRWATVAVLGLFVLMGVLLTGVIQQTRSLNESHRTGRQIASCVTPAGSCYKDGQKQTAAAIGQLNQAGAARQTVIDKTTVAAVACAQTNKGLPAIQACVNKAMGGK